MERNTTVISGKALAMVALPDRLRTAVAASTRDAARQVNVAGLFHCEHPFAIAEAGYRGTSNPAAHEPGQSNSPSVALRLDDGRVIVADQGTCTHSQLLMMLQRYAPALAGRAVSKGFLGNGVFYVREHAGSEIAIDLLARPTRPPRRYESISAASECAQQTHPTQTPERQALTNTSSIRRAVRWLAFLC